MPKKIVVETTLNGEAVEFLCEPRETLLEVLRDRLHLTGTKEGCSNGNCGACSVILDGRLVDSCLVLAAEVTGRRVETIEGLALSATLSPSGGEGRVRGLGPGGTAGPSGSGTGVSPVSVGGTAGATSSAPALHPLQQKFLEHAALQCGVCTPGFIMAAKALLDRNPHPTEHDVRFWLAGNLCRCTGYDKIVRAVLEAAERSASFVGQEIEARRGSSVMKK